jgi:hypothetical protein
MKSQITNQKITDLDVKNREHLGKWQQFDHINAAKTTWAV